MKNAEGASLRGNPLGSDTSGRDTSSGDTLGGIGIRWQIAILAVLAAYFMVWPVWRAGFPIEIAQNEGWNAYHADAAMGAAPLYPAAAIAILTIGVNFVVDWMLAIHSRGQGEGA